VRLRDKFVLVTVTAVIGMAIAGCGRDEGGGGSQNTPGIDDTTVKIGISVPLSGPVSDAGTAQLGGAKAYYEAINAAGGVRMRDGKTRKIQLISYDDGYEPGRSAQNFRRLVQQDGVLAVVGGLGTAQNAAVLPVAKELGVPQVYVASGASLFSANATENPWTIGWQPTYEAEGEALAQAAVALNRPITVAVLRQNDDLGNAFLNGFNKGIQGSQVTIAGEIQTYEAADTTVDSQITNLAATRAEVLLSAVAVVRLQISALTKARELGWKPTVLLPGFTQGFTTVLQPSGADKYFDQIYTTGFVPDEAVQRPGQRESPQRGVGLRHRRHVRPGTRDDGRSDAPEPDGRRARAEGGGHSDAAAGSRGRRFRRGQVSGQLDPAVQVRRRAVQLGAG
jgi:ABC-type branched-subunit amino acid transport system substrate-binding protein